MDHVLSLVSSYSQRRYEDDFIDRLNFQITAHVLALSAVIITYNTYLGAPIICWVPAEFQKGWMEYARDYCLIENTYYLPIEDPDMPGKVERERLELQYYQWVQFILVFFAFLFYLPHLLWRTLNWWSGLQVRSVVKTASGMAQLTESVRKDTVAKVARHISNFNARNKRRWVSGCYIALKVVFVLVIAVELVLIHLFLGFSWSDFFRLRVGFFSDWRNTGIFPRQTMCDFEVRTKGNVQKYSVQCVLSINMINEKIFLALFYWMLTLFVMTVANLYLWLQSILSEHQRREFAGRMLRAAGEHMPIEPSYHDVIDIDEKTLLIDQEAIQRRRNEYNHFVALNPDLYVVLQLIASNAGDNICSDVTAEIYRISKEKKE